MSKVICETELNTEIPAVNYKKILKDNGIKVVSATEKLDDLLDLTNLEKIVEAMEQYYSVNLSREVENERNCN